MHYLALWRMQLASRLLLDGGAVAEVAGQVGYESEAAFSRAFRKLVGEAGDVATTNVCDRRVVGVIHLAPGFPSLSADDQV